MVKGNLAHQLNQPSENIIETRIQESPLKWCSVTLSDVISRGKRLEASVFDVEAKQAWEQVIKGAHGCTCLYGDDGLIKTAYYPGWMQRSRLKRIYCDSQYGEGFYLPSQMTDIYPVPEKHISRLADCDMDELRLKKDTLLLTRSGTIGNVSYVSETLAGRVFSDDVIRITFKEDYDLGYVYAFLKSKVGNLVLRTNGYGAVITHIEPDHLSEIQVPNAPVELRKRIHELIKRSYALRDESNGLLDKATHLLKEELNLPSIHEMRNDSSVINAYNVRLSDIDLRLDASYHIPIVSAITKHLKQHAAEVTTIADKRVSKAVILPGRFKRVYVAEGEGRVFIGGKQLYELDPTNKKYLSLSQHGDRIEKQLELHENMTLITCSGTIGKVALVGKHWEGWAANQHIIRVVPADESIAGYLNVFLASEYGYQLIARNTYGAVIDEIDATHVREIPIPILKNYDTQQIINELALDANQKRYQAYTLEQEALEIMDKEVIFAR